VPEMYPVTLDLIDKECLVIGGGAVAERKVFSLLVCKAVISVVSPIVTLKLQELIDSNSITHKKKYYSQDDIQGKTLVICATDNQTINHQVAQDCRKMGIWVNVVDQPGLCSFHVPAVMRRGKLSISVSTAGASPFLAAKIRRKLEQDFGPEYEVLLQVMEDVRRKVTHEVLDQRQRHQIYSRLLNTNILQLITQGKTEQIKELIAECTSL